MKYDPYIFFSMRRYFYKLMPKLRVIRRMGERFKKIIIEDQRGTSSQTGIQAKLPEKKMHNLNFKNQKGSK